jgi:hypothetical protein
MPSNLELVKSIFADWERGDFSSAEKAANVFTIRDGKVTGLTLYWSRDQAMTELGLS